MQNVSSTKLTFHCVSTTICGTDSCNKQQTLVCQISYHADAKEITTVKVHQFEFDLYLFGHTKRRRYHGDGQNRQVPAVSNKVVLKLWTQAADTEYHAVSQ